MSWYLTFPLITPFCTAVIAFLLRGRASGAWVSVAGSLVALFFAFALFVQVAGQGVVAGQMGGWPAPFGITLVADLLSAAMVLLTALTGLAVAVYALGEIRPPLERLGYHAMFQLLLGGVTGAFLTGDLFNLYVWFEVMLIASFGLLVLGGRKAQIDGAVKYVTLNLISTVLFVSAIGMLYGITGTLNMADLSLAVREVDNPGLLTVIAMMFLVAFGMKAAVFPLFFWLPASYHTPAFCVSAVFAALLSKVGVYSLYRTFTLIFVQDVGYTHGIMVWVAAFTMITGVLGALAQTDFRRVLSFQIISSIGYLILGLALFTPVALTGAIFYLIHTIIVKANLFLISGVSERLTGTSDLKRSGGLYNYAPLLAFLYILPAFSLSGFPPLSGFWGKYVLVKATVDIEMWWMSALVLLTGLLTTLSMMRIWSDAFWTPHAENAEPRLSGLGADRVALLLPIAGLTALTVIIGLFPEPFFRLAQGAAGQLLAPQDYLETVLGGAS